LAAQYLTLAGNGLLIIGNGTTAATAKQDS